MYGFPFYVRGEEQKQVPLVLYDRLLMFPMLMEPAINRRAPYPKQRHLVRVILRKNVFPKSPLLLRARDPEYLVRSQYNLLGAERFAKLFLANMKPPVSAPPLRRRHRPREQPECFLGLCPLRCFLEVRRPQ